jgi:hypothetical protein
MGHPQTPIYAGFDVKDLIPGSNYFRWFDALWLPKWEVYVVPTEVQAQRIIRIAKKADFVVGQLGSKPLTITSWLRPKNYNQWAAPHGVGGAQYSVHMDGGAIDFKHPLMTSDECREILAPELERLGLRMEKLPGSSWVHIDDKEPGPGGRYFLP